MSGGVLSKLFSRGSTLTYNCYEVGHTWTPYCSTAAFDLGSSTLREALKMYSSLYLFNFLIGRKWDRRHLEEAFQSIMRSSLFLSFNAFSVMAIFCGSRHALGAFYYQLVAHGPAIISSYLSILLERPSRRPALAVYVANVASETVYRKLIDKGWLVALPHGETLLFALATATYLYTVSKSGGKFASDPVSQGIKFLTSTRGETLPRLEPLSGSKESAKQCNSQIDRKLVARNALLTGIVTYVGQSTMTLAFSLLRLTRGRKALSGPRLLSLSISPLIRQSFLNSKSVRFGAFVGLFGAVYKLSLSLIRAREAANESNGATPPSSWPNFVAGLLAGMTMAIAPSGTISQHITWKALETLYWSSAPPGQSYLKWSNLTVNAVYAVSTAQLFYVAVIEPRLLRPSYVSFLNRVTDNVLTKLNRDVIDVAFGSGCAGATAPAKSQMLDLALEHTSKKFKESFLVWTIA